MKQLLTLLSICILYTCSAQSALEYLDKHGDPVKEKRASILREHVQVNDTLWEINQYQVYGPMISSIQYRDEKGQIPNGSYLTYDKTGHCDTMGTYVNGRREGEWSILSPNTALLQRLTYVQGMLTGKKNAAALRKEETDPATAKDSSRKFTRVEIESMFPGGPAGWLDYMNKNLRYPDRAIDHNAQGTAVISFIVDASGHIEQNSISIVSSVEYSIDSESLKLIRKSPDWIPAIQNGRSIRSYKKQPVVFKLTK